MAKLQPENEYTVAFDDDTEGLLHREREALYDYLYRMTGDMSLSFRAMEEVADAVLGDVNSYRDYNELRVSLYATGRRFNIEHWNAETRDLTSSAPMTFDGGGLDDEEFGSFDPIREVEQSFCRLPGPQREVLLLHLKSGFSIEDTAQIMGSVPEHVKGLLQEASQAIEQKLPGDKSLTQAFNAWRQMPLPDDLGSSTMALSQVIENVKGSRSFLIPPWLVLVAILVVTALVLAYFKGLI